MVSRLLTSKQLQLEGEFYQNFMEGGRSVAEFCSTDVEPMYRESDHIHIIGEFETKKVFIMMIFMMLTFLAPSGAQGVTMSVHLSRSRALNLCLSGLKIQLFS